MPDLIARQVQHNRQLGTLEEVGELAARLAREGWQPPPHPERPDAEAVRVCREICSGWKGDVRTVQDVALAAYRAGVASVPAMPERPSEAEIAKEQLAYSNSLALTGAYAEGIRRGIALARGEG